MRFVWQAMHVFLFADSNSVWTCDMKHQVNVKCSNTLIYLQSLSNHIVSSNAAEFQLMRLFAFSSKNPYNYVDGNGICNHIKHCSKGGICLCCGATPIKAVNSANSWNGHFRKSKWIAFVFVFENREELTFKHCKP